MQKHKRSKLAIPAVLISAALAVPAFAQAGVLHAVDNTTNPNTQNATNPDAQVPPSAPGAAVGNAQPAVPAQGSSAAESSGGSSSFTNALKDTDITAKVKYALHENNATSGGDIHVTTDNGVVTLTGQVQRKHEAMEAARIAQTTTGVRQVVNQLEVNGNGNG